MNKRTNKNENEMKMKKTISYISCSAGSLIKLQILQIEEI